LILRGIKTAELRSMSTTIVGERFYIYACKKKLSVASCQLPVKAWSDDLRVGTPPAWMIELAEQVKLIEPGTMLPTGVIVGSAVIERVTPPDAGDAGALFHLKVETGQGRLSIGLAPRAFRWSRLSGRSLPKRQRTGLTI
jgi:hypothetical protein